MYTTRGLSVYFHRNFKTFKTRFLSLKNKASPLCTIFLLSPYFSLFSVELCRLLRYHCFVTISSPDTPANPDVRLPDANILGALGTRPSLKPEYQAFLSRGVGEGSNRNSSLPLPSY